MKKQEFKKMKRDIGTSGSTLNVEDQEIETYLKKQ